MWCVVILWPLVYCTICVKGSKHKDYEGRVCHTVPTALLPESQADYGAYDFDKCGSR